MRKRPGIVGFVPGAELVADGAMLRLPCRHLLEPDDRLDSFDLAEEQRRLRLARAPVIEQPCRLVCDA
jgi:hypothetical protein